MPFLAGEFLGLSDGTLALIVVVAILVLFFAILFFNFIPVGLWISAISAGVKVSIFSLVGMRLRRVRPARVINPLIKGTKAGLEISQNQLESHLLSGGRVDNVVDALIAAHRANMELSFERAAAIDLAGRDVFEAVRMSVMPKIIETPMISAMAVNGIEIKALAKVTVRANIARLVGGAGEDTIIARVGEGIVTTIGSAKSHQEVLENPDKISQTVLNKGLDSGTAYEILSIDIADIDVGRNIGAQLQIDQAEADKRIAQAKAEERRATAIAKEQEMKAQVEEMRSKVVEAEAQVPRAIAEALSNGNLGVMDLYNMQNKLADTKMREGLANVKINLGAGDKLIPDAD
ncbi:MAG: flotillin-like protein FloA [Defluviitaleaceae bacterium]|nr:flotillin-like protein FloA [Defluviitaleaceae bacterium]